MQMKNKYTDDSIISLEPREFCRLRPATYLGSNEYSTQLVREVFSNALDEHIIGHGNTIWVEADLANNVYKVKDEGQGFPINVVREDGETVLQAAFDKFNTSGKYDDNGVYSGSVLGLNGIGNKLTNFLSTSLTVSSSNGSTTEHLAFEDGIFKERKITDDSSGKSGTEVTWSPDPQFFQNHEANISDLRKLFEDIAALCPELTIHFKVINNSGKDIVESTTVYHSDNGIQDLVDKKTKGKEILNNRFVICKKDGPELFDITLTYTSDYSETVIAYANYGLTESGVHISTVKAGLTRQINRYAADNNLLKKTDDPITQSELSEGFYLVFNVKASRIKYDSQTKTRIVDLNKTLINSVINNDFYDWLNNNPKDAKIIVEKALLARKARIAAQKAKDVARGLKQKKSDKFLNLPTKLVDAYSKDRSECELFVCEGDSAANGLIAKRDGKTQAVFPIRGKILSCRKAAMEKVYSNQEIANIVKAIGLDIEKTTGKLIYDKKKLRYGKIILAADSDADGYDIRLLLINMLWWLCPDLLTNSHVYVALPPLYRITTKKNEYIFLKDDQELADYKKKHKNDQYIVSRNKGLGEQDASELAYCLLKDNTRNVQQLIVTDQEQTDNMLEMFMGNSVEPRRNYLLEHAHEIKIDVE
jgi:DNA gyrase subunit B